MCKWYWRAQALLPLILADVRFQAFLSSLYLTAIPAHLGEVVFCTLLSYPASLYSDTTMSQKRKLSHPESYNIGWIAALPIERAAAIALLNERHDEPEDFDQHRNDGNAYDWGKVGHHNVVIASLPAGVYGTTSAAITASHLLSSLPHIKIGLLVGIGGGIPRPGRDIRLGDVVVSQPDGKSGGVIQYDLGKAKTDSIWERKGSLNMPPTVLLSALARLQAEHELEDLQTAQLLEAMTTKFPRMKTQYSFQGVDNDRLFPSTFKHSSGDTCDLCELSEQVVREKRESTDPVIHYGLIASGNTLVKDADTRENIFKLAEEECLCVEMEAAGLANTFPCLVIRGICDYADSHKNDKWQRYASATAAAFAVELLKYVPVRQLQAAPRAVELMEKG
jgi:nucleoside phosphorylase